jgi:hypothetical protein
MTFRELIDRRWDRIKIVVVPLLIAALILIGNDPPWTTANCIGVAVLFVALIVILPVPARSAAVYAKDSLVLSPHCGS